MKNALKVSGLFVLSTFGILVALLMSLSTILSGQIVKAASTGDKLFAANCAACHNGGKNAMNPKKPVIGSAKLANKEAFKEFLLKPSGIMSPFPAIANNSADLTALLEYCKSLK